MILEALPAMLVIVAVAGGLNFDTYSSIVYPTTKGAASNPILAFSLGMGTLLHNYFLKRKSPQIQARARIKILPKIFNSPRREVPALSIPYSRSKGEGRG